MKPHRPTRLPRSVLTRREFLEGGSLLAGGLLLGPGVAAEPGPAPGRSSKTIGLQIGAVSFVDEGTDAVLDLVQERGGVNTLFVASFTYGRGIAGRQIPGLPFPDHGRQESDQATFRGGNYATPHPRFYRKSRLKPEKAPDLGNYDVLADVVPKAHRRGLKVYAWYEDVFRPDIPGVEALQEIDLHDRRVGTLCPLNPDYRAFVLGLTEDFCRSYPIDGVMWGSERQGPLLNALSARHGGAADPGRVTCFCDHHRRAARRQGLDLARARAGFEQIETLVFRIRSKESPVDGAFVSFWRVLLEYPELVACEKLWTDAKHRLYADIHAVAKQCRPDVQVGFHIWHNNSFSPWFRAQQDYAAFARVADFLKVVVYNNCGGPRYVEYLNNVGTTLYADVPRELLAEFHHRVLGYEEDPYGALTTDGLSPDYVFRETQRALKAVQGRCRIYPGIDVDIPTGRNQKKTRPEDVYNATASALMGDADGVVFSRKYSEMQLANLAAGGKAVREFVL